MNDILFDISYLLIPKLRQKYYSLTDYEEKADFLLHLLEYGTYFKDYAEEINQNWYKATNRNYIDTDYIHILGDKEFIRHYAQSKRKDVDIFDLINKLCNPENYDHDEVIADKENEISIIAYIDDFEFTHPEDNKRERKVDKFFKFKPP